MNWIGCREARRRRDGGILALYGRSLTPLSVPLWRWADVGINGMFYEARAQRVPQMAPLPCHWFRGQADAPVVRCLPSTGGGDNRRAKLQQM